MLRFFSRKQILLVLTIAVSSLTAQRVAPFETVEIGVGILPIANDRILDGYWQQTAGFSMNIQTPFYWGTLSAGIDMLSLKPTIDAPDITLITPWLELSTRREIVSNLSLGVGTKLGIGRFSFAGIGGYGGEESEVMAGLSASAHYKFLSRWRISVGYRHDVMFTARRILILNYRAGLTYRINSPTWFRNFLR